MNKKQQYQQLIDFRKEFKFPVEISNYEQIGFELNHVDGWEAWHSDLDADIMLVGQDFSDVDGLLRDEGKIEKVIGKYKNDTNKYLEILFKRGLGIDIGHPISPNKSNKLFFTNALVGLKKDGMQAKINPLLVYKSAETFLKPLIEIIQPKAIIALGQLAFNSIYFINFGKLTPNVDYNLAFEKHVAKQFITPNNIKIFPVYHCGSRGIKMNRNEEKQIEDWKQIRILLDKK